MQPIKEELPELQQDRTGTAENEQERVSAD